MPLRQWALLAPLVALGELSAQHMALGMPLGNCCARALAGMGLSLGTCMVLGMGWRARWFMMRSRQQQQQEGGK